MKLCILRRKEKATFVVRKLLLFQYFIKKKSKKFWMVSFWGRGEFGFYNWIDRFHDENKSRYLIYNNK